MKEQLLEKNYKQHQRPLDGFFMIFLIATKKTILEICTKRETTMTTLKKHTVWVMGGGSGIGRTIALKAANEGARVWISGRTSGHLEKTASLARKSKRLIRTLVCDATQESVVRESAVRIIRAEGKIDSLVVSVGWALTGSLENTSLKDWKALSAVHLDSLFLTCREALRGLKKSKAPSILIIGSIFGLRGKENRLAYCTMKGGVANFVRALSLDLASSVRVNSICPGWVQTDMSMSLVNKSANPQKALKDRHEWHPMGRGGKPEEVAALAVFLMSEQSGWITGQNIAMDGGYTAR